MDGIYEQLRQKWAQAEGIGEAEALRRYPNHRLQAAAIADPKTFHKWFAEPHAA